MMSELRESASKVVSLIDAHRADDEQKLDYGDLMAYALQVELDARGLRETSDKLSDALPEDDEVAT